MIVDLFRRRWEDGVFLLGMVALCLALAAITYGAFTAINALLSNITAAIQGPAVLR